MPTPFRKLRGAVADLAVVVVVLLVGWCVAAVANMREWAKEPAGTLSERLSPVVVTAASAPKKEEEDAPLLNLARFLPPTCSTCPHTQR